jgi:hypothetical protein
MTNEGDVVGIVHRFTGERFSIVRLYSATYVQAGNSGGSFPVELPVGAQSIFHGGRWCRRPPLGTVRAYKSPEKPFESTMQSKLCVAG